MSEYELEIRRLADPTDMHNVVTVFQQVWGSGTPIVGVELLRAISHSGGYVAGAFESGSIVGASFGFLAEHAGERALHSHVTGILPGVQHSGVGRAMKHHQRAWATEHSIRWITWTFDPLVRRNAWFNLGVLGVEIAEYLVDFYGPMSDVINANDTSDRLLVAWSTRDPIQPRGPADDGDLVEVPTPDDIVALRRTDPAAAAEWRRRQRAELEPLINSGGTIVGMTRAGDYQIRPAP